jgi:hypothetical protein
MQRCSRQLARSTCRHLSPTPARPVNPVALDAEPGCIVAVKTSFAAGEVHVYSWEQARRISRSLHGWVFRGQSSARHGLTSSIERAAKRAGIERRLLRGYEEYVLVEFQRRAHHYLSALPPAKATLEWLALLPHHGAPTRLLDFTGSFYIAAFFACEFADGDAAIWAINAPALRGILAKKASRSDIEPHVWVPTLAHA